MSRATLEVLVVRSRPLENHTAIHRRTPSKPLGGILHYSPIGLCNNPYIEGLDV